MVPLEPSMSCRDECELANSEGTIAQLIKVLAKFLPDTPKSALEVLLRAMARPIIPARLTQRG